MTTRRWGRVALTALALACAAATLLALILHQVETPWQPTIVLATFSHYLMWTAPVALVAAACARRWVVLAVSAVLGVVVLVVQLPAVHGFFGLGSRITVLQANLKVGAADPADLVALVREHHVQLLATEELTDAEQHRLVAAGLPTLLPYRFTAPLPDGGGGLGLWSTYPLRDRHNLPGYELGVLTATVARPGPDLTAVAVHLLPSYPYPAHTWRHEIAALRNVLDRLPPGPVVVPGDFNATVDHGQFRDLLGHGYTDAADDAGAGYLPTYPNDRWYGPLIGIDHVLLRGNLRAGDVETLELPGSDHRALLARLTLTAAP